MQLLYVPLKNMSVNTVTFYGNVFMRLGCNLKIANISLQDVTHDHQHTTLDH